MFNQDRMMSLIYEKSIDLVRSVHLTELLSIPANDLHVAKISHAKYLVHEALRHTSVDGTKITKL